MDVLWVSAGLNTSAVHRDSLCKTMPSVSACYKDEQMTPASHRSPKNLEKTNTSAISRHRSTLPWLIALRAEAAAPMELHHPS